MTQWPSDVDRREDHAVSRVNAWVTAGLISEAQADEIRRFEQTAAVAPSRQVPRFGIGAEVSAYLGSVLALMGGIVVVGRQWRDLETIGRLGIAGAVAAVGLVAGAWLVRFGEPGATRLGGLLWVVGAAGVGLAVGVVLDETSVSPGATAITVGGAVSVLGFTLWRNLDRALQMLTAAAGIGIMIGGVLEVTDMQVWQAGVAVWAVAAATFGVAATGRIRPQLCALAIAAIAALLGSAMLSDLDEHLGPSAAAATAALIVGYALAVRSTPMLVLGILGFLMAVQSLLATTFTGAASSGLVTLVGLTVVTIVVVRAVRGADT